VVVVPIMSDQPYSAERCAALELGQVIDREHRTPADIRDAVRAVLADPSYRANTEAFQQEMLALPGPDQIPGALEELVAVAHT
jgi:UDP:flavonoid glycosyltransferase YjiC (YdhE family)